MGRWNGGGGSGAEEVSSAGSALRCGSHSGGGMRLEGMRLEGMVRARLYRRADLVGHTFRVIAVYTLRARRCQRLVLVLLFYFNMLSN